MEWVRYKESGNISYGFIMNDMVIQITGLPYDSVNETGWTYPLADVELLVPCEPSKIVCLGLNYLDHASEMHLDLPKEPLVFIKPSTTVIAHKDIILHPDISNDVHYEGELGVVIKKDCRNIKKEDALDYVFGYTCANDVTARDLQKKDGQWTRAKSFDTFCPLGPCIETELNDSNAFIKTYVNGQLKQSSNINQLIFNVPEIIEFVSSVMTLKQGDVILTGTPSGVGQIKRGDVVAVEIEGVGLLENLIK